MDKAQPAGCLEVFIGGVEAARCFSYLEEVFLREVQSALAESPDGKYASVAFGPFLLVMFQSTYIGDIQLFHTLGCEEMLTKGFGKSQE